MAADYHFTHVDTQELKALIYRKIGHERAEKYFDYLKRFFNLKLSKVEFDKNCKVTIGGENIWLHNKLIQSILQNVCQAKPPPQKVRKVNGLGIKFTNGYQRNCLQSLYGDAFPHSPRKCRSPVNRDRKFRDRPSPLGPFGKSPSITTELHSLCSRPPIGIVAVEDGEEVEQFFESLDVRNWRSVTAPFGVSVNMADATHTAQHFGNRYNTCSDICQKSLELPDTRTLTSRLEKKLALEGLGISVDCANLLNNSLDIYLKRLIEPCMRSQCPDPRAHERQSYNKMLSGSMHQSKKPTSALDLRVGIESNPHILGEDRSIQLEKISLSALQ